MDGMNMTGPNSIMEGYVSASLSDRAMTYSLDAAKSIYRLFTRRVRRTAAVVNSEYNLLNWHQVLSAKAWTQAATLGDFLIPTNPAQSLRKVDNHICRIAADEYYRYRTRALGDLIARHAGGVSEIVGEGGVAAAGEAFVEGVRALLAQPEVERRAQARARAERFGWSASVAEFLAAHHANRAPSDARDRQLRRRHPVSSTDGRRREGSRV